jgi:hypothetical protein
VVEPVETTIPGNLLFAGGFDTLRYSTTAFSVNGHFDRLNDRMHKTY